MSEHAFIDPDLFDAGGDAFVGGQSSSDVWSLKADKPMKGYFLANVSNDEVGKTWLAYRETFVEKYKINGQVVDAPVGMKTLPVFDYAPVQVDGQVKLQRVPDPLLSYVHLTEKEMKQQAQNHASAGRDMKSFKPRVRVSTKFLVNFLMEQVGEDGSITHRVILLKLSQTQGGVLRNYLSQGQDLVGDDFDMTAFPHVLKRVGTGASTTMEIKALRKEGPTDLPFDDIIDPEASTKETRERIERWIQSSVDGVTQNYSSEEFIEGDASDAPPWATGEVEETDGGDSPSVEAQGELDIEDEEPGADLLEMSSGELKDLLTSNGIEIPTRVGRAGLLKLAQANGLG